MEQCELGLRHWSSGAEVLPSSDGDHMRIQRAKELLALADLDNGVVPFAHKRKTLFTKVGPGGLTSDEVKQLKQLQGKHAPGTPYYALLQLIASGKA